MPQPVVSSHSGGSPRPFSLGPGREKGVREGMREEMGQTGLVGFSRGRGWLPSARACPRAGFCPVWPALLSSWLCSEGESPAPPGLCPAGELGASLAPGFRRQLDSVSEQGCPGQDSSQNGVLPPPTPCSTHRTPALPLPSGSGNKEFPGHRKGFGGLQVPALGCWELI